VATGQQHAESLLVGATADEFTSLGGFGPQGQQAFVAEAHQRYGARTEQFLALYSADSDQAAQQAQIASQSDLLFAGMQAWANAHAAHHPNNVYLYYFDRRLPGRNSAYYGAFHSGDLYYVFGTLASTERPWEVTDYALADAMTSYWANFAATGDPNSPGVPVWPTYKPDDPHAMQLGTQIGSMPLPKPARLQFFRDDIANWLKEA
jgi:carboxylesterase type B